MVLPTVHDSIKRLFKSVIPNVNLIRPSLINNSSTVCITLLQRYLVLPLRDVDGVDVASWLAAETTACYSRGLALDLRHVDTNARVELEGRLGAQNLEVYTGARVVGLEVQGQRL